jgi:predicted ATPase
MIKSIQFKNFKVLRDTTLPLGRCTLIVGPNGSGKSTALQAFGAINRKQNLQFSKLITAGVTVASDAVVSIEIEWDEPLQDVFSTTRWLGSSQVEGPLHHYANGNRYDDPTQSINKKLGNIEVYALDPDAIVRPVQLHPIMRMEPNGQGLAGALDQLRDRNPDRFERLNDELGRLLPDFDRILFETPDAGRRSFALRTRQGGHGIPATDLSHGTLLALALLTLAHLPEPPPLICVEDPDRGLHPRLLRDVQDVLYRLSYPESMGEVREPVQVIATTHSPYLLDLFRDHPEEVVIAEKVGLEAKFKRLSDQPHIDEVLGCASLGEIWYSGVLGGVPSGR